MRLRALLSPSLVLVACSAPDVPIATVEHRDSAGVSLISVRGPIEGLAAGALELEEVVTLGHNEASFPLFGVVGASILRDGYLAVGNRGTSEIAIFDPTGGLVRTIGRAGDGPGEFRQLTSLHVDEGGSLLVFDDVLGRLSEFDVSGRLVSAGPFAEPNSLHDIRPLAVTRDGRALAVFSDNRSLDARHHVVRDSTPLLRFDGSIRPDTLLRLASKTWSFNSVGAATFRVQPPFSPDLLADGIFGRVALGDTHRAAVAVWSVAGTIETVVRWEAQGDLVRERDLREWQREAEGRLPRDIPQTVAQTFLNVDAYETLPVLRSLVLARTGGVWLAPTSLGEDAMQSWILICGTGEVGGSVRLPTSWEVLDVDERLMVALHRDDLDVEQVSLGRLSASVSRGCPSTRAASDEP